MIQALYAFCAGTRRACVQNMLYQRQELQNEVMYSAYFNWCIVDDENGPVLVDQLFSRRCAEEMHIPFEVSVPPTDLLKRTGFRPEDVKHVVLTHLHWDHYAGDDFYPEAMYYVHQQELNHVVSRWMRYSVYSRHYYMPAVRRFLQLLTEGRVRIIDGKQFRLCPGITCLHMGAHTPGLMAVMVEKGMQRKILTSDVLPMYRNFEDMTPCGIHDGVKDALTALEKIRALVDGDADGIIPGHDAEVLNRYPEESPSVIRIL